MRSRRIGARNRAAPMPRHGRNHDSMRIDTVMRRGAQPRRARLARRAADAGGVHHALDSDGDDSDGVARVG